MEIEHEVSNDLSEPERKKLTSKARQAAIMAQFAQAQESFLANFGDQLENEDEDMTAEETEEEEIGSSGLVSQRPDLYPTGSCIFCQEELDENSELYGMLSYIQETNLNRYIDCKDVENVARIISSPVSFDTENNLIRSEYDQKKQNNEEYFNGTRLCSKCCYMSSCGHLMHMSCFERYMVSVN